ncbi:hypothetical protein WJX72_011429 [[Myrmecia] bisecta]|uniref:Uncharacterized protein n=1 Tax=[Myrmecia] bisecta TaxID=41462 RepID=A0AAW1PM22_9CHLO
MGNLDVRILKYVLRGFALKLVGFGPNDVEIMRAALGEHSALKAAQELHGYPKILAAHLLTLEADAHKAHRIAGLLVNSLSSMALSAGSLSGLGVAHTVTCPEAIAAWFAEQGLGNAHKAEDRAKQYLPGWQELNLATLQADLKKVYATETQ